MPLKQLNSAVEHTTKMLARAKTAKNRTIIAANYADDTYNGIKKKFKSYPEEITKHHALALNAAEQATAMLELTTQAEELTKEAKLNHDLQRTLDEAERATNAVRQAESAAIAAELARDMITCTEISSENRNLRNTSRNRCVIS